MIILTIRTDKPDAEVGLFKDDTKLHYETWQAHRQLAETIHTTIAAVVRTQGYEMHEIGGIIVYRGPGSFTGLRIGISVANALAYGLEVPIVGAQGEDWLHDGRARLLAGETDRLVMPEYGAPVHITLPKT